MAINGNPKKMAQDIAEGYVTISPPALRQYTQTDMQIILNNLERVIRDLRQEKIALDDVMALKARNNKISRANQSMMVVRSYCKRRSIKI